MLLISCSVAEHGSFLVPNDIHWSEFFSTEEGEKARIEILEDCARFLRSCTCEKTKPLYLTNTETKQTDTADKGFIEAMYFSLRAE